MKNNKITFRFESDMQKSTMIALFQSFEESSINMDKFLIWFLKNYDPGSSLMLKILKQ